MFDRDGNVLSTWGAGLFAFPHTIRADAQDNLWIVDRDHAQMFYFSPTGTLLRTIGTRGYRSDTGVDPEGLQLGRLPERRRTAAGRSTCRRTSH